MTLRIRPPRDVEWPICRMLLPETFGGVGAREYLLGVRDEAPQVAAAVSFQRVGGAVKHLRLHVLPAFRRRGVGSQIIECLAMDAAALEGLAEITKQDGAVEFCEQNRFQCVDRLTTVEGEIAGMREHLASLGSRKAIPGDARIVPLSQAPLDQVARLHAQFVAHDSELNPWRGRLAHTPAMDHSPVVMIGGQVAGILLWELEGTVAVVRSRVVKPEYQRASVNRMLLAEGLDGAWARGARTARFAYTDPNADTKKLAERFGADIVSVIARFRRGSI